MACQFKLALLALEVKRQCADGGWRQGSKQGTRPVVCGWPSANITGPLRRPGPRIQPGAGATMHQTNRGLKRPLPRRLGQFVLARGGKKPRRARNRRSGGLPPRFWCRCRTTIGAVTAPLNQSPGVVGLIAERGQDKDSEQQAVNAGDARTGEKRIPQPRQIPRAFNSARSHRWRQPSRFWAGRSATGESNGHGGAGRQEITL